MKRFLFISTLNLIIILGANAQDTETVPLNLDQEESGFVIIGKEHLPDFTVLIDRENLSKAYDLELKESFLPKIIQAVKSKPF
tara:strand:- start:143 stop:391 length:249 start_codon:yes stop_codon:yes gene_type:complete